VAKHLAKVNRARRAYELDALIAHGMRKTIQAILEIGAALKEVRDERLYAELGYVNFEAYTVERCQMARANVYRYIGVVEKLPLEFVSRVGRLDIPPSFRRLAALPNDQEALSSLTAEDIERLRDMSDADFDDELAKLKGYDRSRDGGRGPSDLDRPHVSRDRYRDQAKKLIRLKEKYDAARAEMKEILATVKRLCDQNEQQRALLMADDRTRAQQLVIEQLSQTISEYKTSEAKTAVQKVDRETAIRLITELRIHVFQVLRNFREEVHLPDIETAAWFDLTCDGLRLDLQQMRDFVASEALKQFGETGVDTPLPDASVALATLTKAIRKNMAKLDLEAGLTREVGKPKPESD